MHEVSLGEAILDAVERRAAGRKVRRVKVRVGTHHGVVGPALDQGFELVSEGTVAQGPCVWGSREASSRSTLNVPTWPRSTSAASGG